MSGIYIPGDKVPTGCVGCGFRDPEYGGNCVLMPSFDAGTYEEQFERCPFKELRKQFGVVPPHGDLIDLKAPFDALYYDEMTEEWSEKTVAVDDVLYGCMVSSMPPVIIPADPAKEGEG